MSSRTRVVTAFASVAFAAALVAGCSSTSSKSSSTSAANKGFDVSTPAGDATLSLNGNLPPGWPSGFPVPSGAKPAGSGSLKNDSKGGMVGVYTVSGSASDAYDFYANNSSLTVTQAKKIGIGGAFIGRVQFSGTYTGSATVTGHSSTTYLVVVLQGSADATTTTS